MVDLSFSMSELEYLLLIVVRVSCFIYVAPFFSLKGVPAQVKIIFSVVFSYMLYLYMPAQTFEYNTVLGFAVIAVKEAVTGLLIGYGANISYHILGLAGHLVDMETGLSMVTEFDPITGQNITISGSLYQYIVTLMMFISGLYQFVLAAMAQSFTLIPVNAAVFSGEKLITALSVFMIDFISIAFRISLPVFCAVLLLNAVLGILAKITPQLHMFSIGIQLKILTGFTILILTVGFLPNVSVMIMDEVRKMLTMFVEAMI